MTPTVLRKQNLLTLCIESNRGRWITSSKILLSNGSSTITHIKLYSLRVSTSWHVRASSVAFRKDETLINIHHTDEFEFDSSCVIRDVSFREVNLGHISTTRQTLFDYIFLFSCGILNFHTCRSPFV